MIEKVAIRLSAGWGRILDVPKEDVECYRYGLELLLSTLCNILLMIVVSVILQMPLLFLPYTFVYVPMRLYAGGFHASSHFRCIAFSSLSFLVCAIAAKYSGGWGFRYVCLLILIISVPIFYKFVPVISPNKPLSDGQIVTAKRNVKIMEAILVVFWIVLYCTKTFHSYVIMCFYAELSVVVTLILGQIKNHKS